MQIFEMLRFRLPLAIVRRRTDVAAGFTLFLLTLVGKWGLLRNGNVIGADSATQYYPWYSFLGESLGSGDIPGARAVGAKISTAATDNAVRYNNRLIILL